MIYINECAANNGGCPQKCVNTVGSFHCECYADFSGNGLSCTDINECSANNGGCPQKCVNTLGSFNCECYAGFLGNGITCTGTLYVSM